VSVTLFCRTALSGTTPAPRGDEPGQISCLSLYLPRSPPAPISQATYRVCPSICATGTKHPPTALNNHRKVQE